MLNYEMFNGEIFVTTDNSNTFGVISYVAGLGFYLWVNEVLFSKAFYASQNEHGCMPAFKNLEAVKYFALSLYLEHGAE